MGVITSMISILTVDCDVGRGAAIGGVEEGCVMIVGTLTGVDGKERVCVGGIVGDAAPLALASKVADWFAAQAATNSEKTSRQYTMIFCLRACCMAFS